MEILGDSWRFFGILVRFCCNISRILLKKLRDSRRFSETLGDSWRILSSFEDSSEDYSEDSLEDSLEDYSEDSSEDS